MAKGLYFIRIQSPPEFDVALHVMEKYYNLGKLTEIFDKE
jgi:hypothetical protein